MGKEIKITIYRPSANKYMNLLVKNEIDSIVLLVGCKKHVKQLSVPGLFSFCPDAVKKTNSLGSRVNNKTKLGHFDFFIIIIFVSAN